MTLTIRRPRKQRQVRFQSQRDDMHRQAYEKELATFHVSKEGYTMGWTLNKTQDWKPIIVAHINCTGYIADWNRKRRLFQPGQGESSAQGRCRRRAGAHQQS